jgi:hypothetical protein
MEFFMSMPVFDYDYVALETELRKEILMRVPQGFDQMDRLEQEYYLRVLQRAIWNNDDWCLVYG